MGKCPVCKSEDGCKFLDIPIVASRYRDSLTADDWKEIHHFLKYIWMPFLHRILARSKQRIKDEASKVSP